MVGFCALDSHHSRALKCQQLSDLERNIPVHFGLIVSEILKKKSIYVSLCYSFNLSQLKYFHFKPTYKQDIFGLLLTLHATLLKIKVSYHKASHSVCHSSCQRLVSIVSVYIICTGISGPYYPQIDD